MFKTEDFNFNLPSQLIAQEPFEEKEKTPMLIFKDNQIIDKKINDLIDYFSDGDVIVFNKVKVIKAKFRGKVSNSDNFIDFNLDQELEDGSWKALCRPAKKVKNNDKIIIAADFCADIEQKNNDGSIIIKFNYSGDKLMKLIEKYGNVPLPPYIKRSHQSLRDEKNYQTIYAKNGMAVAAPTAGLHFNDNLLKKLLQKNIQQVFLTLNVGAGTFLPVRTENIQDHQMHHERFVLSEDDCNIINYAKKHQKKIIAVGTTSLRALESSVDNCGILRPQNRYTNIFIYPPYNFKVVDVLLTNFHLPKSTLFMLICAFVGYENALKIYDHAIKNQYRFYSYGDASLLFMPNTIFK